MEISILTIILLLLALWMLMRGLSSLKIISYKKNKEEAEKIFRERVVIGEKKAIENLLNYFNKIKICILISMFYFILSFGLVLTSLFTVNNLKDGSDPSPVWQLVIFSFILFVIPTSIVITASFDLKTLKTDILNRFRLAD